MVSQVDVFRKVAVTENYLSLTFLWIYYLFKNLSISIWKKWQVNLVID